MKNLLSLIFAVLILHSVQAQKTELSLNLKKGEEYTQVTNSVLKISQKINGQETEILSRMKGAMSFMITAENEDHYEMQAKFREISISMEMPQGTMEFSSEKNDLNDVFSSLLSQITHRGFGITMSKSGRLISADSERLWDPIIDSLPGIPDMKKQQLKVQLKKAYGENALKGNMEMITAIFPENPVNIGDHWQIETHLESGMSGLITTDYEFADLAMNYALIKGTSSIETADKEAYVKLNGMPVKYDLEGTMTSEIKVDRSSGWIIEAQIEQEIAGEAKIKPNDQLPLGMNIPMTMSQNLKVSDN